MKESGAKIGMRSRAGDRMWRSNIIHSNTVASEIFFLFVCFEFKKINSIHITAF